MVLLRLAGKLYNVVSSHSGISHSRRSHSLAGLSRGHVCDLSTIKQHPVWPCFRADMGTRGLGGIHTVSHCLTCGFRLEELCILLTVYCNQ